MGIFLGRKAVEPAPRASGDAWGWKPAGIFKAWNHPKLLAIKKKHEVPHTQYSAMKNYN
jgi:hypothetical protein